MNKEDTPILFQCIFSWADVEKYERNQLLISIVYKHISTLEQHMLYKETGACTCTLKKTEVDGGENGKGEEFRVASRLSSGQVTLLLPGVDVRYPADRKQQGK